MALPKVNPLRGHYMLVGTDLVRTGVRTVAGETAFYREDNGQAIDSVDPANERWVTSRAVSAAAAKAGIPVNMAAIEAGVILQFLLQDPKAAFRLTEDAILHLIDRDVRGTPEAQAYAAGQVAELVATYQKAAAQAA